MRLAWAPFSLGSPGFPFAHLTNDLQPTTALSWAPSLEFGLNYTQQKEAISWKLAWEKAKKKKKKNEPSITNFLHSDWFQKEREKKKSWVKSQFFKEHDLCRVRTARSVLLSEETPKHGTRGHRFALSQTRAACVAMVTTKLVSVRFPRSGYASGMLSMQQN